MKTKYTLIILVFILIESSQISAQTSTTITTPKGTDFTAWVCPEIFDEQEKQDWSDYYEYWYPDATEINAPSTTSTYNCHSYAWNMTEGGPTCWIGLGGYDQNPEDVEDVYWTDQSYIETTEANASKISYYVDNHSAIQTSTQGIYISKWGNKVLMQHARDYGPAGYEMDYRKYYRLSPLVTGSSDLLCANQQRTYSSDIEITGSTYYWTRNESLLDYVSGQGSTDYRVKVKSNASGNAWVRIQITTPSGEVAISPKKYFWAGVPDPTIDGDQYLECYDREWYFLDPDDMWGEGYYWHTTYQLRVIGSPYGHKALIEALEEENGLIFCDVDNECGTGYGSLMVWIECWFFKMSPNPADDYVEISIDESKMVENKIDEYEVRIYNGMNIMVSQLRTSKPTLRINTSQFINGIYTVHFITGDKLQVEKLVISH